MRTAIKAAAILALIFVTVQAQAQSHQPYAGLQSRPIKALSAEQIADLRAGRGMSLALAAELNGYPGPLHVIEHANALQLTPDQLSRMGALFDAMRSEAIALGERLINQEADLDRQFSNRTITEPSLKEATAGIGATQAQLRATHLRYHLLAMEILTSDQVQRYADLRGYTGANTQHRPHGMNR
jgi:hypothetical protein